MANKELVQLRSAKMGNVRCPLKGTECYGGFESIIKCPKCDYHRGLYDLPKTVAVACAYEYDAWNNNGISVFTLDMLQSLIPFKIGNKEEAQQK